MSDLSATTDPTGNLSQTDLNTQDISNLIDTVNTLQNSTGNIINQPTYVEVNDGTNNRALMGYNQATGTWGLFATPPGVDISTATTIQQFSFSSDARSLIVLNSTTTGTLNNPGAISHGAGASAILTVPHNLGYIPTFLCYVLAPSINPTGYPGLPTNVNLDANNATFYDGTSQIEYVTTIATDITNIYMICIYDNQATSGSATPINLNFTYYLLNVTA